MVNHKHSLCEHDNCFWIKRLALGSFWCFESGLERLDTSPDSGYSKQRTRSNVDSKARQSAFSSLYGHLDTFKFSLPKGSIIGMLGRENGGMHTKEARLVIKISRRTKPEWLIRSTEHYFNPADLQVLGRCQVFMHREIKVKRYLLNSEEQILEFGFIPSTELYQPTIRKELIEINQSKFNDNNSDDDSSEGDDWGPDDDRDSGWDIDPDNPFGVSPEEAETIYWNTH